MLWSLSFWGGSSVSQRIALLALAACVLSPSAPALDETKVTDAGLKDLAAFKSLTRLNLENSLVTDAGVEELKKALPKCTIKHPNAEERAVARIEKFGGWVMQDEKRFGKDNYA